MNLMRILFIFLALSFTSAWAQEDPSIDSLKTALSGETNDNQRVDLYFEISYSYQWLNPDSALTYAIPGLALAKKLNDKKGEYKLLLPVTEAFSIKGNFPKAIEFRFRALELAREMNDPKKIGSSLALLGNTYLYSKDYSNALTYLYQAKANKAISIGGPQFLPCFIGQAYFELGNIDSALAYIQLSYNLDKADTNGHWSIPYQCLAAIYEKKGDFDKTLALYHESLPLIHFKTDILKYYTGIATVFHKKGQQDSAIFYGRKAIEEATLASIPEQVIVASQLLASIYKSMNKNDSVLKYQNILIEAKDSLFSQDKVRQVQNITYEQQLHLQEIETEKQLYKNKVKEYSLIAALVILLIIGIILWRNNKLKQKTNLLLHFQKEKAETALKELKSTQAQLVQSEKMASLGELTAGIAHEIQNPLNFVNNFSEVSVELIEELKSEKLKPNSERDDKLEEEILNDVAQNLEKINHHGKRADAIVKGMLQHSRTSSSAKEPTDINKLADEYLRLAYHGIRAKDNSFNATLKTAYDDSIGNINIIPQDIGRVILNLITNAFYAVAEKKKQNPNNYEPTVTVKTSQTPPSGGRGVIISVTDNGNGIPQNIIDKIFQPFFTTKPTGQGTGLGLSLAYDIVKAHGGELKVETNEAEGTTFIIQLPVT